MWKVQSVINHQALRQAVQIQAAHVLLGDEAQIACLSRQEHLETLQQPASLGRCESAIGETSSRLPTAPGRRGCGMTDDQEAFDDAQIARRRDEALARLLKMPPKPHEDMKLGKSAKRKRDKHSDGASDRAEDAHRR